MNKVEQTINNDSLLLSAQEAARILGIGRSLFYSMHSSGTLGPLPVKLGRRTLWKREELEQWVRSACPPRNKWEAIKRAINAGALPSNRL